MKDFPSATGATGFQARSFESVSGIGANAWRSVYGDTPEGYDYFRACENAAPPSFSFSAVGAFEGDEFVAGAPIFQTSISLDLVLDGFAKRTVNGLSKLLPSISNVPMVGIGTPYSHDSQLGFDQRLSSQDRNEVFGSLVGALEEFADSRKADLILIKDASGEITSWADQILRRRGYARITGLPIAKLSLPASEEDYIRGLSTNMRSNLRRRLKRARNVRVELRTTTDGIDPDLLELRENTVRRAAADYDVFEEVSTDYFAEVLQVSGHGARLLTYWLDRELIGFSLVLVGSNKLVQTYNGMRYPEGPDNGLFYLDWMSQIRLCLECGIPELQSGVTTYLIKARLGCQFHRSYIYVRHTNPIMNAITKLVCPFINLENDDQGLKELGEAAPFV